MAYRRLGTTESGRSVTEIAFLLLVGISGK